MSDFVVTLVASEDCPYQHTPCSLLHCESAAKVTTSFRGRQVAATQWRHSGHVNNAATLYCRVYLLRRMTSSHDAAVSVLTPSSAHAHQSSLNIKCTILDMSKCFWENSAVYHCRRHFYGACHSCYRLSFQCHSKFSWERRQQAIQPSTGVRSTNCRLQSVAIRFVMN